MDQIDYNIPLYNILQHQIAAKYTISDFFYANLKLQLINQKYKDIQERARQLLSGVDDPLKSIKFTSLDGNNRKRVTNSDKKNLENGNQEDMSVHAQLNSLMREASVITQRAQSTNATKNDVNPENNIEIPSPFRISRLQSSVNGEDRQNDSSDKSLNKRSYLSKQNIRKEYISSKKGLPGGVSSTSLKEDSLPLIFRLPTDILQYLTSNRIEALVYGGILLVLIAITSSLRPPGNKHISHR